MDYVSGLVFSGMYMWMNLDVGQDSNTGYSKLDGYSHLKRDPLVLGCVRNTLLRCGNDSERDIMELAVRIDDIFRLELSPSSTAMKHALSARRVALKSLKVIQARHPADVELGCDGQYIKDALETRIQNITLAS